jgi:YD repeat-containing protein
LRYKRVAQPAITNKATASVLNRTSNLFINWDFPFDLLPTDNVGLFLDFVPSTQICKLFFQVHRGIFCGPGCVSTPFLTPMPIFLQMRASVLGSWYLQQPNASAWVQNYVYDLACRMTGITSPAGRLSYTHNLSTGGAMGSGTSAAGSTLISKIALPNGASCLSRAES